VVVVGITGDLIGLKMAYMGFAMVGFLGLPFVRRLPVDNI
jgi:hypothetical protein